MDLTPHVERLGQELVALLESGSDDARAVVDRLVGGLDAAIRLTLLETLSVAADEIGRELAPGSVELRLRARDPEFVVTAPPPEPANDDVAPVEADIGLGAEDGANARINLRLSDPLKAAIEEAAAREGRSVNAWLVRVASAALRPRGTEEGPRGLPGRQRLTGWVQ